MKISTKGMRIIVNNGDGDRYVFRASGRVMRPGTRLFRLSLDDVWELEPLLSENRPDFAAVIKSGKWTKPLDEIERDTWSFLDLYEHTTKYALYDSYKGEAIWREQPLPYEDCPATANNNREVFRIVAENHGVPATKAFLRLYEEQPVKLLQAERVMKWGIRNPDNVLKILQSENDCGDPFNASYRFEQKEMTNIVRVFIREKGENATAKLLLCSEDRMLMEELGFNVDQYSVPDDVLSWIVSQTMNLHDIINTVVDYINNCPLENVEYTYSNEEKKLEGTHGILQFRLPKDARALAVLGADMGICVGCYVGHVEARESLIVAAYDGETPVACIDVHNGRIQQMRGRFNYNVAGKYQASIDSWLEATGINPEKWYVFGENDTPAYHGNWDVIHPEQYDGYKLRIIKERGWLHIEEDMRGMPRGDFDENGNFIPWDEEDENFVPFPLDEENGWE